MCLLRVRRELGSEIGGAGGKGSRVVSHALTDVVEAVPDQRLDLRPCTECVWLHADGR